MGTMKVRRPSLTLKTLKSQNEDQDFGPLEEAKLSSDWDLNKRLHTYTMYIIKIRALIRLGYHHPSSYLKVQYL